MTSFVQEVGHSDENALPSLPPSADRNLSPRKVSQKGEYLGTWPETFGEVSLRLWQFGVWRPNEKREKARILQAFRDYGVIYLRLMDWLAPRRDRTSTFPF